MNSTSFTFVHDGTQVLQYSSYPFYFVDRPTLLSFVSDHTICLIAPILAYWSLSFIFHLLDASNLTALEQYRIHDSAEVSSRNLATREQVVRAVVLQQAIQTALGLFWIDGTTEGKPNHSEQIRLLSGFLTRGVSTVMGEAAGAKFMEKAGAEMTGFVYWWAIPIAQFLFAMFVIDTWQYFLHRLFHVNKFLYKHFHSVHHRLYVPYAFGALYNHPLEGFLLDSLGAAIAHSASFMTIRQATLLFTISTLKTVDDHCGYRLPFDPLQWFSTNTADYHDIHHQVIGIKHNFSQPFFVHWDVILGTRMTRKEVDYKRQKLREKTS